MFYVILCGGEWEAFKLPANPGTKKTRKRPSFDCILCYVMLFDHVTGDLMMLTGYLMMWRMI
jgi:hypothetical protein